MCDGQNVCRELDKLSFRILELMNEQIQNNKLLEQTMKYGFIDIAKARYIMGNRNLSKLQLPGENSNEFTAINTVKLAPATEDESSKFSLITAKKSVPPKTKNPDDSNGLRKRTPEEIENCETAVEESIKVVDPLKWFGLLVPQNLRSAQSSFGSAVELVTQGANIQMELEATRHKYRELSLKKNCGRPNEGLTSIAPKKKNRKNKPVPKSNIEDIENTDPRPGLSSSTTDSK